MLAIRLRRTGSKKRPFFRVVVTDSRAARDSSFVEVLGYYNPRTKPETLEAQARSARSLAEGGRAAVRHRSHARGAHAGGAGGAAAAASRVVSRAGTSSRSWPARSPIIRRRCSVTEREHRGQTLVELFMAPGDLGRVIGRQGRTADAMRTLVAPTAELEGTKATLEFRDDE